MEFVGKSQKNRPEIADFGFEMVKFEPEMADFKPEMILFSSQRDRSSPRLCKSRCLALGHSINTI